MHMFCCDLNSGNEINQIVECMLNVYIFVPIKWFLPSLLKNLFLDDSNNLGCGLGLGALVLL